MKQTTDSFEIRRWSISKGGTPARTQEGELTIDFENDPDLESLTWDEFFEQFERDNLALEYEEHHPQARFIGREEALA